MMTGLDTNPTECGQDCFAAQVLRDTQNEMLPGTPSKDRHASRIRTAARQGLEHREQYMADRLLRSAALVEIANDAAHGLGSRSSRITTRFNQCAPCFHGMRMVELQQILCDTPNRCYRHNLAAL